MIGRPERCTKWIAPVGRTPEIRCIPWVWSGCGDIAPFEAARILGLSTNRARELAKVDELRPRKPGRDLVVTSLC